MGSTGRREKSVAGGRRGGEVMKGGRESRSRRRGGYRPSGRDFLAGLARIGAGWRRGANRLASTADRFGNAPRAGAIFLRYDCCSTF